MAKSLQELLLNQGDFVLFGIHLAIHTGVPQGLEDLLKHRAGAHPHRNQIISGERQFRLTLVLGHKKGGLFISSVIGQHSQQENDPFRGKRGKNIVNLRR